MTSRKSAPAMNPTKEQWKEIEDALSGPFGTVKLRCDGYEITAVVGWLGALKFAIAVYIDGQIKGEWLINKDERCLKFFRKVERYTFSAKARQTAKKEMRNRRLDKDLRKFYADMANAKVSGWYPDWTNPAAFCRHIRKTCQSIELLGTGLNAL